MLENALFFVTHKIDKKIQKQFEKIRSELKGIADVFITGTYNWDIKQEYKNIYVPISLEEMRDKNKKLIGTVYNGNCHMTPILIKNKKPGYLHYWFIEYDVLFTGDLKDIFKKVENDNSELITTHIKTYESDLEVSWIFGSSYIFGFWDVMMLWNNQHQNIPLYRAFLQFYRISNIAIDKMSQIVLNNGWGGHFESLLPTALIYWKMKVSQFWGESEFTPQDRKWLFYHSYPTDTYLGTFRFRPPILNTHKKWYLFHPVKKIKAYGYLKNTIKQFCAYLRLNIFYNNENYTWNQKKISPLISKINQLTIKIENSHLWISIDRFLLQLRSSEKR